MDNEDQDPSKLSSALTGLQSGATLGFSDEVAGLSGALGGKSGGDQRPFWDIYRDARDQERQRQIKAKTTNPASYAAGNAGSMALAGPLASASSFPAIAAIGGLSGLGNSDADLTKGEYGQAALDAGKGATTSAAFAAAAPALAGMVGGKIFRSPEAQGLIRAKGAQLGVEAPIISSEGSRNGIMKLGEEARKEAVRRLSQIKVLPLPFGNEFIQPTQSFKPSF